MRRSAIKINISRTGPLWPYPIFVCGRVQFARETFETGKRIREPELSNRQLEIRTYGGHLVTLVLQRANVRHLSSVGWPPVSGFQCIQFPVSQSRFIELLYHRGT